MPATIRLDRTSVVRLICIQQTACVPLSDADWSAAVTIQTANSVVGLSTFLFSGVLYPVAAYIDGTQKMGVVFSDSTDPTSGTWNSLTLPEGAVRRHVF